VAMVIALLFAACDKERCEPAPQTARSPDQSADLRKAAENSVRFLASNPDFVRFRGVQVWPQAVKNQLIGIGGRLTAPPLPHHRAYGSRTTAVRLGYVGAGT
jgi:hypothetical protein